MEYGSFLCCIAAFLLYYNTLNSEFVYDDRRAILTNPDLQSKTPWTQLLQNDYWGTPLSDSGSHGSYRPLTVFTFRLNYLFDGFNPWSYHFINVCLHCSATVLLIKIANKVLPKTRGNVGSMVTGALFATHPIHTEAVAGVVGRADLISCNLFFLSLLAYIKHVINRDTKNFSNYWTNNNTNKGSGFIQRHHQEKVVKLSAPANCNNTNCNNYKNTNCKQIKEEFYSKCYYLKMLFQCWWWIFVCIILGVFAMLAKETGITVFGVIFVYDLIYSNFHQNQRQKKSLLLLLIVLFITLSARLQTKPPQFSTADNPIAREPDFLTRLLTFSYLPVFNFWLMIYPNNLSFDWGMDAITKIKSIRDPRVLCIIIFYTLLICTVYKCVKSVLDKMRDDSKCKNSIAKKGCMSCNFRTLHGHSQNCRLMNNNNNSNAILCICPTIFHKIKGSRKSSSTTSTLDQAILFSISMLIFPFLPASNLFFYVGFVVAERILYIPSAGLCLLLGLVTVKLSRKSSRKIRVCFHIGLCVLIVGFSMKTLLRNIEWHDEESLYGSAIPFNPPKAYGNLGSILNTKGRTAEAEVAYRKALEFRPNMADVHYNLGILLQGNQQLDEAIQSYKRAIHFRPTLALAYVNLGTALIAAGRCKEAIEILRQGSQLDSTGLKNKIEHENAKISALLQLGALYSDQGRLKRALSIFKEAAYSLPTHYPPQRVYNVIGETLVKLNQDEEAEKWYRAALNAAPNHVPAHITYGKLLAKNVSRSAEAEQWFRKAQRLAPDDPSVYHHYGAFLALNRRFKEAALMYEKAAELQQDDYELAAAVATAMRRAERQEDAERWYRKAVSMKPTDARVHTNLGAILHLNGKYREAEHSYKEALRLEPDDKTTLMNLKKLYGLLTN